jgi:protein-disulfide isomerase
MSNFFRCRLQSRSPRGRASRSYVLRIFATAALCFAAAICARAQSSAPPMRFHDVSALKPPAGARVAIIEFDDMECPACAEVNPVLMKAAAQYKIPWIRHDFLIPFHQWSPVAAVNARWFDSRSKALGGEYRNAVFADQRFIFNLAMLGQFTDRFAASHGVKMPDSVDPHNQLYGEVQADTTLAKSLGLNHTPTIFIARIDGKGALATEVTDPYHDLDHMISQAMAASKK